MQSFEQLSQSIISFKTIEDNIDTVYLNNKPQSKISKFLNGHFFFY